MDRDFMVPIDKNPETETIKEKMDQYQAETFPHRKIVLELNRRIKDNKMAGFFHKDDKTLCMGCHHNTPGSIQPPKCASCHGQSVQPASDGRPGLKGAYHGQCISCHQVMKIEKPAATDCIVCHKEKA